MKKSILLFGKKGSGKTHKLNELMLGFDKSRSIKMRFNDFKLAVKSELKAQYDVIAIDGDGIGSSEQIDYIQLAIRAYGFFLIVTTQKSVRELKKLDLQVFEAEECSYSYTGA